MLVDGGRALLKAFRRVAANMYGRNTRQPCLVDNMAVCVCVSFERIRAHNFNILAVIRRLWA